MAKLTLIRGLPGSGKSTLAKTLSGHHLEADMFFVDQQGEYQFDLERLPAAHLWCQQQTERLLAEGKDVVVSNTFVRRWEMKPYQQLATKYRAELQVVVCSGNYPNVHGVSTTTIEKMRRRWQS
ncbi:AAA family ATPase [Vibrio hippocampi]|uniref:ATP-binding protein n=1 Tax=Vibrio hippocampi TaxID=654686 RepID=A0ABN8DEY6_9VIBR|nr:ATP-binding protein [Vibrio hippocampi]CAH0525657.1 hypothetical protein VHP8226_01185 [Vibrio hippocampi]